MLILSRDQTDVECNIAAALDGNGIVGSVVKLHVGNAKSHCITDRPKADRRIRDEVDKGIVVRTWRVLIWSEKCFRLFEGPIRGRFVGVWRMGE